MTNYTQPEMPPQPAMTQANIPAPPQPAAGNPPLNLGVAGQQNTFAAMMATPQPVGALNRDRADDGDYIVQLRGAELKQSNEGLSYYLKMVYMPLEADSRGMNCVQRSFDYVLALTKPFQLQELAGLAQRLWGEAQTNAMAQQGAQPLQVAQWFAEALQAMVDSTGCYSYLEVRRSQKQLNEGKRYADIFPRHHWFFFSPQYVTLEQAKGVPKPQQGQS